ncbi:hypothetical protein [Flavihumibacter petaseus]|uniref:Uncharacterized protein n=1 Tax=Flavihumibacter petaseus NBRC 106054 TaxID=1220578 RepID=A0A0E9N1T0_9BACT|nr:hypothetical protein [Flavihumibacter petaseus]GAO43733.1 hypothetical protein FPE01S_02_08390 [Flavihumibacter petaseus NBRC 106054]
MSKVTMDSIINENKLLYDEMMSYHDNWYKDTSSIRRDSARGPFKLIAKNKYIDSLEMLLTRVRNRYDSVTKPKIYMIQQRLHEYEDTQSDMEDILKYVTLFGALITLIGTVGGTKKNRLSLDFFYINCR